MTPTDDTVVAAYAPSELSLSDAHNKLVLRNTTINNLSINNVKL